MPKEKEFEYFVHDRQQLNRNIGCIEMQQAALGGVSSDSPLLQNMKINEYNDRLAIITSELANRRKVKEFIWRYFSSS